jgi:hypothetical protein
VESDYVYVAVIRILCALLFRMILTRTKFYVVTDKISLMNEILFNDLFKDVFFSSHWIWNHSGKHLQGIPDLVIRRSKDGKISHTLVDAKNRVGSAEGEVVYKLLGYKENLRLTPFLAVALFPEFGSEKSVRSLFSDDSRVVLARIPLASASNDLMSLAKMILTLLH